MKNHIETPLTVTPLLNLCVFSIQTPVALPRRVRLVLSCMYFFFPGNDYTRQAPLANSMTNELDVNVHTLAMQLGDSARPRSWTCDKLLSQNSTPTSHCPMLKQGIEIERHASK